MMISYSAASMLVDILESHADRPLTEAEIEAGGLVDLQATRRPAQGQGLGPWNRLYRWRFPGRRTMVAARRAS